MPSSLPGPGHPAPVSPYNNPIHPVLRIAAATFALVAVLAAAPPRAAAQEADSYTRSSVYSSFLVGSFKYASGDVLDSVDHLEFAWRMSGHESSVGMRLAESYYLLKNFTRCEMVLDDVLDEDEFHREALMLKAKVRYIKRDRRTSVLCLEKVREHHPMSFETERLLGNIYYEMGDSDNAIEAYRRCLSVDSSYPYIQYRYGRLLLSSGRTDEAEQAFREAVRLDPEFVEPAVELAELYIRSGHPDDAVPYLERVIGQERHNDDALLTLVNIHTEAGRTDEAISLLEESRSTGRLSREGELVLGRLYFDSDRFDEATTVFSELFRKEPGSSELARILAEVRLNAGDTEGARVYFERAIAISPRDYRNYLGLFFAGSDRFTTSVEPIALTHEDRAMLLREASGLISGDDFDGNYMVGLAYLSIDSLDSARGHLVRARTVRPDDYNVLINLANVYERERRYTDARSVLDKLHERNPDDPTVLNFYGYVLAQMGADLEMAKTMVSRALDQDPDNGYYLDSLGWIYYQMGDYARAVTELEKASSRVGEDPVILEHLGDAYATQRRFAEARSAYERSNRLQGGSDTILEKIESTRDE